MDSIERSHGALNDRRIFWVMRFLAQQSAEERVKYFSVNTVLEKVQIMMGKTQRYSDIKSCILHLWKLGYVEIIDAEGGIRVRMNESGFNFWQVHGKPFAMIFFSGRE